MISLVKLALLHGLPMLRQALFGDRLIRDLVKSHIHLSIMFLISVVLAGALVWTVLGIREVKSELAVDDAVISATGCIAPEKSLLDRKAILGDLLK